MPQHTLQQLHRLRLTGMADALSRQLDQPGTYEELGFLERLKLLINVSVHSKTVCPSTQFLSTVTSHFPS